MREGKSESVRNALLKFIFIFPFFFLLFFRDVDDLIIIPKGAMRSDTVDGFGFPRLTGLCLSLVLSGPGMLSWFAINQK